MIVRTTHGLGSNFHPERSRPVRQYKLYVGATQRMGDPSTLFCSIERFIRVCDSLSCELAGAQQLKAALEDGLDPAKVGVA